MSLKTRLAAANAAVPRLSVDEVRAALSDPNTILVDVRDEAEVRASGKLQGARNVSRGLLEFKADPESPAYNAELFGPAKSKSLVLYCASGSRSALAGLTLMELGYPNVRNAGAFRDLKDAVPVEPL